MALGGSHFACLTILCCSDMCVLGRADAHSLLGFPEALHIHDHRNRGRSCKGVEEHVQVAALGSLELGRKRDEGYQMRQIEPDVGSVKIELGAVAEGALVSGVRTHLHCAQQIYKSNHGHKHDFHHSLHWALMQPGPWYNHSLGPCSINKFMNIQVVREGKTSVLDPFKCFLQTK